MSDKQTLLDMIADMEIELISLRADRQRWKNIAARLYNPWTHMEGVEMYREARDD